MQGLIFNVNNNSLVVQSRTKKYAIFKDDIKYFLGLPKVELRKSKDFIVACAVEALYNDIAFIDGNYLYVNGEYCFSDEDFSRRLKKFEIENIEKRRCKVYPNILVRLDGSCKKFTDCLMDNNGVKPEYCIASNDVVQIKKCEVEEFVDLETLSSLDSSAFEIAKRKSELLATFKIAQCNALRREKEFTVANECSVTDVKITEEYKKTEEVVRRTKLYDIDVEYEVEMFKEELKQLLDKGLLDEESFNIAVNYFPIAIEKLTRRVCPFVERVLSDNGVCTLLRRKFKPRRVTSSRQPYTLIYRMNLDCCYSYTFNKYEDCWVYKEFAKRKRACVE